MFKNGLFNRKRLSANRGALSLLLAAFLIIGFTGTLFYRRRQKREKNSPAAEKTGANRR